MVFKKTTIFVVIFMLIFSSLAAAGDIALEREQAAKRLLALELLTGYTDGSLRLENSITRAEFTTLAVRLIGKETDAKAKQGDTHFKDVKKSHWASGYVNVAINEGLVNGYTDGTFRPENKISHAEILAVLVRILGYDSTVDKNIKWPLNYVNKSVELGVNKNYAITPDAKATRGDVVVYVDNSLLVKLNRSY